MLLLLLLLPQCAMPAAASPPLCCRVVLTSRISPGRFKASPTEPFLKR
jgi:hypothetical protein